MNATPHTHDSNRVILCSHITDDGRPVLQVTRDLDGEYQFLCGSTDHLYKEQVRFACWTCTMDRDSTLAFAKDLWPGYTIRREAIGQTWMAAPTPEDELQ